MVALDSGWGLQTLPSKLTEADSRRIIDEGLKNIDATNEPNYLYAMVDTLAMLQPILSDVQQWQVLDKILRQWQPDNSGWPTDALCRALEKLAPRLSNEHAKQAFNLIFSWLGQKQEADDLGTALRGLAARLTESQAQAALDLVANQIGQTTDPKALHALAQVLKGLGPKLTETQAREASDRAQASLGWATNENEAANWAQALVSLPFRAADRDGEFVTAIAYPAAAGSATEVLFDAIRAGHPDAPKKEAGAEAALEWLAKKFPDVLRPPLCPMPLQPESGLKCPPQEITPPAQ
jgi:hypothetical protein